MYGDILRAWIDNNNILYWEELGFDGSSKTFQWDISNDFLEKCYDLIPEKVAKAALMTGEFYWDKGDRFTDFYPEVVHVCKKAYGDDLNIPEGRNVGLECSSNPCINSVRYEWMKPSARKHYKFNKDFSFDKEKGVGVNNTKGWYECPRCRMKWAIYSCKSTEPKELKKFEKKLSLKYNLKYFFKELKRPFSDFFEAYFTKYGRERWAAILQEIDEISKSNNDKMDSNPTVLSIMHFRKLLYKRVKGYLNKKKIPYCETFNVERKCFYILPVILDSDIFPVREDFYKKNGDYSPEEHVLY